MIWAVLLTIIACDYPTAEPKSCDEITISKKKDKCLHDEISTKTSAELPQLIEVAQKISDPLIRGAAVSAWVRDHSTEITQKQGMKLCELLDGRDRFYCMRRLSSPHLKR